MATVNLGSIKFKWKGTYAGGTAYTIDDVVSYNGSSYICIQASTGNLPTDTAYFEQMSQKGTNGTDGTDLTSTLTTQGDILYRDGSGLAKLGAGTSGQVLQSGGTGANPSWIDAGGGITEADMWRLNASQAGGTNGVISSNLERVDETSFAKIGTGMSVSSGHWVFPSTGLWHVIANPTFSSYFDGNTNLYINVSADGGSTYDLAAESNAGHSGTTFVGISVYTSIFVNVTNTSNYRVQFETSSVGSDSSLKGTTNSNRTNFIFIRLGDSQ